MHVSEGILPPVILLAGGIAAVAGTAVGLKALRDEDIPKAAVLTAGFFVASLVHVPVGVGSMHLVLNGLMGVMLGWAAFPAILVGLFLQALLFGFGGLTVLGVNVTIMAWPAVMVGLIIRRLLVRFDRVRPAGVLGFIAGSSTIFISSILLSLTIAQADPRFAGAAMTLFALHLPMAITEGAIVAGALVFLRKVRPAYIMARS
jgi:cobalt/nickel transport system permease protein